MTRVRVMGLSITVGETCLWCLRPSDKRTVYIGYDRWQADNLVAEMFRDTSATDRTMLVESVHPACWPELLRDDQDG